LEIGANGRKYDPSALSPFQADSLRYAVLAQCAYRVAQGEDTMAQTDEYLPVELRSYRVGGAISRQAAAELAGTGLIVYAGTVSTIT
jgi:hypothetical protein